MPKPPVSLTGIVFLGAWCVWAVLVAIDPHVTNFDSKIRTQLLRYHAPEKITDEFVRNLTRFLGIALAIMCGYFLARELLTLGSRGISTL